MLVGFVGLEGGKYSWIGVFGADQIGSVRRDKYLCVGVPFSPIVGMTSLLFGQRQARESVVGKVVRSTFVSLGYEDGIGGNPSYASRGGAGYRTVGPFAYLGSSGRIMSASGPVGVSVAVGPIAAVARVRAAAMVNFAFGFIGWHPFPTGSRHQGYGG